VIRAGARLIAASTGIGWIGAPVASRSRCAASAEAAAKQDAVAAATIESTMTKQQRSILITIEYALGRAQRHPLDVRAASLQN